MATVALALWLRPWAGAPDSLISTPPHTTGAAPHRVDLVFAVDTTGSMGGLLDGAKRTVWSIASHIRDVDPQADLRVGLVAYKDLGDVYVTKDLALTNDLDAVFAELSSYTPAGGGDEPEDVDAALFDAVHKMAWRGDAKKMIFLVGDAPPASRNDVPRFEVSARAAAEQQIMVNAIRCGTSMDTERAWQTVASLGGGEYSTIAEDGGVQQVATPYDAKLAELSHAVDATAVIYGDRAAHAAYETKMAAAAAAPAPAMADRASYYAKKPSVRTKEDIVDGVATGKVKVDTLEAGDLPSDLQGLSKEQLESEITTRAAKRGEAQKAMAEVAKQRDVYLHDHAAAGSAGFDDAVKGTVDRELAK